jgi:hypothetical protein
MGRRVDSCLPCLIYVNQILKGMIQMEKHISLIEAMPFFETFHDKDKAIIDIRAFEKWIRNFGKDVPLSEKNDSLEYKISQLKEAMKDNRFLEDMNDVASDFEAVDLEGWE